MRRTGFTVVELLIVVAIIGVLSAMVFPIFTQARQAALTGQCFSNVRNIAAALNMYLDDYGAFPPQEDRQEAIDFFSGSPGAQHRGCYDEASARAAADNSNPYLQWPVILDPYLADRSVWDCPEAKLQGKALFIISQPDWLQELKDTLGSWGSQRGFGPSCSHLAFPSGWGGTITDSIYQRQLAGIDPDSFVQSIGVQRQNLAGRKARSLSNPSRIIVAADSVNYPDMLSIATIAYPDICCAECSGITYFAWGQWPPSDEEYCGTCTESCRDEHANIDWARQGAQQKLAGTRHDGGSNVGFADGHAQWYPARRLISLSDAGYFRGTGWFCSSSSRIGYTRTCGAPPEGMIFSHRMPIDERGRNFLFPTR